MTSDTGFSESLKLCLTLSLVLGMIVLAYCEAWLSLVERCVRDAEVVGSNPVASTTWQGQPRRSFTDLRGSFFARSNEPCVDDHKKARWELAHIRAFLWLATYGERRDSYELPRSEVTCRQGSLHYKVSHAWTGWQADAGSLLTGRRMADWTHTANAATVTSCSAAK